MKYNLNTYGLTFNKFIMKIKLGKRKILFEHIDYLGSKRNNNGWRSFSWSNFINCETIERDKHVR
jgi:hypothetical protein